MHRSSFIVLAACAGLVILAAGTGDIDAQTQVKKSDRAKPAPVVPATGQQSATPTGAQPLGESAPVLGRKETASWTPTTWEAATAEANKKILEGGKVVTVTGEVVDVSCYLQLGKRGPAHVDCGSKCIANGQPIGLVDADENLYLLMAEEHHPRRDGKVELKTVFLPLLAKTVTVNGIMTETKNYRALFVQAAELSGAVTTPTEPEKK